jgi:hypothetical protein
MQAKINQKLRTKRFLRIMRFRLYQSVLMKYTTLTGWMEHRLDHLEGLGNRVGTNAIAKTKGAKSICEMHYGKQVHVQLSANDC